VNGGKLRVLVADNHEQSRWVVSQILGGVCELMATDGDSSKLFDSAISSEPDVIVSVITLPAVTGAQAIEELKRQGHNIPLVLVCSDTFGVEEYSELSTIAIVEKIDIGYELVPAVFSAALGQPYVSRSADLKGFDVLHPPENPAIPEFGGNFREGAHSWARKFFN
jgi:DNA-binding NarL/FixJ family response regulator